MNVESALALPDDATGELQDEFLVSDPKAGSLRRLMAIAGGLLAFLLLLAIVVPVGGAVIGGGQVAAESKVKHIAHPIGGVVAQIAVVNGQHVEKGQLLMRLDNRVTSADATYSTLTVEQLLSQRARLEAERSGSAKMVFPQELTNSSSESARKAMVDEANLFSMRRSEEAQLRAQLVARIEQYNQNIVAINAQIASLQAQRRLIEPELRNVRELWNQQLVTISRVNQLERSAVDLDGNIAAQQAQIAQVRARISETQEQLIQMGNSRRVEAGQELGRVNTALNEQRQRNVTATDQDDRSEIRAPYSGFVEKMAFTAVGEVIRPAEPIMEIVPDHDQMVVEAMVSPTDVDQVRLGQTASIRFTAFNRAATPEITGKVTYVATDRSEIQEMRQSFFIVRVAIDQRDLKSAGLELISGMPAEVYIQTGSRSLMSYLTKPLRDQLARSFRDN